MDDDAFCHLEVLPATPGDEAVIGAMLEDVQRWMAGRGIAQWTRPFGDAWIAETIATGEFHIARLGDVSIATFRLLWADPLFWGARDQGDAAYIHTMAVRRDYAGRDIGAQVLRWAAEQARANGRRFLRLDCEADNAALAAYYRRLGFTPQGTARIGGTTVMLLEKDAGA